MEASGVDGRGRERCHCQTPSSKMLYFHLSLPPEKFHPHELFGWAVQEPHCLQLCLVHYVGIPMSFLTQTHISFALNAFLILKEATALLG